MKTYTVKEVYNTTITYTYYVNDVQDASAALEAVDNSDVDPEPSSWEDLGELFLVERYIEPAGGQ